MTRQQLDRIFFIYSEASISAMMAACALIELACSLFVPRFFWWVTLPAAGLFAIAAAGFALYVIQQEQINK